jgi:hypothetical protein
MSALPKPKPEARFEDQDALQEASREELMRLSERELDDALRLIVSELNRRHRLAARSDARGVWTGS